MNLQEKTYKNYIELCNDMGWKTTGGKTKQLHLKELERYCKFHREGHKIVIDEVFSEDMIQEKEDMRNKYNKYIEKLIIDLLSKRPFENNRYTINVSRNTLYEQLHMINCNYNTCRNDINKFSRYIKVPTSAVHDFYNNTSGKLEDNVERTLNNLQNQGLIKWKHELNVALKSNDYIVATEKEIDLITEAERKALINLDEKSKKDIFQKRKWNEFKDEVKKLLIYTNIKYYYKTFLINTTSNFREILLEKNELETYRNELNSTVYVSAIETAKRKNEKIKNKYRINSIDKGEYYKEPIFESEKIQILDEYISYAEKIANTIITNNSIKIDSKKFNEMNSSKYTLEEYVIDKEYEELGNIPSDENLSELFYEIFR